MEQIQKERFENIKKAFYAIDFGVLLPSDKIDVTPKFIEDFKFLIKLVENLDAYNKLNKELMKIEVFMKDEPFKICEQIKESKIDCNGNLIFFGELTQKQFYIKKESFEYYTLKEIKSEVKQ